MSTSKTFNVSFNVTVDMTDEDYAIMARNVLGIAKWAATGDTLPQDAKNILVRALTVGPDGVVDYIVRTAVGNTMEEAFEEMREEARALTFTPVEITEV